jgi:hypothetical protein
MNNFLFYFSKNENKFIFKNIEIILLSIIYYKYCDMGSEIIQNVAYNNYDNFQYVNFIFS